MAVYTKKQKLKTKYLWLAEIPSSEIKRLAGLNSTRVIYKWAKEEDWTRDVDEIDLQLSLSIRYNRFLDKEGHLTKEEKSECEWISRELLKIAKFKAIERGESLGKGRRPGVKNGEGKAKKRKKNDVSHLTHEDFAEFRKNHLHKHQMIWWEAGQNEETRETRFIVKSRKVGGSWFLAYEGFEDLTLNHNDQAFISATRQQAEVFKSMIAAIALEFFDVVITGNPGQIKNGNKTNGLHYLSASVFSAQTFGGSLVFDEVFWTRNFTKLYDVASPIASFDAHKVTLISTPSTIGHEAYKKWSGAEFNEGKDEKDRVNFSVSHKALKDGRLCEDYIWRQIVTLKDVVERGFDDPKTGKPRINIEKIRRKMTKAKYDNFYGGKFVDDTNSYWSLNFLLKMGVEDLHEKIGYKPDAERPFGNRPVGIGYDPGGKLHFDATAMCAMPTAPTKPFVSLGFRLMKNMPSYEQFSIVKEWMDTHNVVHFEFDTTGPGQDMEKYALSEFPHCVPVRYTPTYKTAMVNKADSLFHAKRFIYDANDKEIPLSFMTIYQTTTAKTGEITYKAMETEASGHGDLAHAQMHVFMGEELVPDEVGVEAVSF